MALAAGMYHRRGMRMQRTAGEGPPIADTAERPAMPARRAEETP